MTKTQKIPADVLAEAREDVNDDAIVKRIDAALDVKEE